MQHNDTTIHSRPGCTVSCLACDSRNPASTTIAIGFDDGEVHLQTLLHGVAASKLLYRHGGAVLCCAFSTSSELPVLVTGGADGQIVCSNGVDFFKTKLIAQAGATAGAAGVLIESVTANAEYWAAPVGRFVAVGKLPSIMAKGGAGAGLASRSLRPSSEPAYLGPLVHVVDAVQLLDGAGSSLEASPRSLLAACSFGGLRLWNSAQAPSCDGLSSAAPVDKPDAPTRRLLPPPSFALAPSPVAARGGPDGTQLACDGWARSLAASPDGAWLASWVVVAGDAPTRLWLWRTADGADFECCGYDSSITALAWSGDSHALATCSGGECLVWRFPPSPPPHRGAIPLDSTAADEPCAAEAAGAASAAASAAAPRTSQPLRRGPAGSSPRRYTSSTWRASGGSSSRPWRRSRTSSRARKVRWALRRRSVADGQA